PQTRRPTPPRITHQPRTRVTLRPRGWRALFRSTAVRTGKRNAGGTFDSLKHPIRFAPNPNVRECGAELRRHGGLFLDPPNTILVSPDEFFEGPGADGLED